MLFKFVNREMFCFVNVLLFDIDVIRFGLLVRFILN